MIYATTDLHGYSLDKFKDFLNKVNFGAEDHLYILGDVIDRGPDGVKLLRWIMQQKNVTLLRGNHEDMLLKCDFLFDEPLDEAVAKLRGARYNSYRHWMENSGWVTLDALAGVRDREIQYILEFLRNAPLYAEVSVNGRDFILVHAGLGNFSKDKKMSEYTADELIWERPTLYTDYFYDGPITVLGHSPTVLFGERNMGRILRTETWIDIDIGVGIGLDPVLLCLDDLTTIYYKDIKDK